MLFDYNDNRIVEYYLRYSWGYIMIRWLHISDLHISNKADWNNFKTELMNRCKKIGKINLVIVTGDFHNFVEKNDFSLAKEFLKYLIETLGLDIRKDLFVVPGNHDGITEVTEKKTYVAAARGNPMDLDATWIKKLQGAFVDYEIFVRDLIPDYPVAYPSQVHHRIWDNKINFIHCNTALVADGKQKQNQLMDIHNMALEEYRADIPNIILAHNSFFDMNIEQQKRIQDIVRIYPVCAYFCGDRHIENVGQIVYEYNQNRQIPCIVSYKSSPDATDDYSVFGMIIGEWKEEEKTAFLKGWTWKSGKGFETDPVITEQEIDMTGRLECFSIVDDSVENLKRSEAKAISTNLIECVNKQKVNDKTKKIFIQLYYKMTPAQIDTFNRKYVTMEMKLNKMMSSKEVFDYVIEAERNGLLHEMIVYMTALFK